MSAEMCWLAIPVGFGLALLALGCIAQACSWVAQAWRELSEFDRSYSVIPASVRDLNESQSELYKSRDQGWRNPNIPF